MAAAPGVRSEQLKRISRLLPENGSSQGHNLALTVLRVPNFLDSGGTGNRHVEDGGREDQVSQNFFRAVRQQRPVFRLQETKSPFSGPWSVQASARIRRLVVQIEAIEQDYLLPRGLQSLCRAKFALSG